MILERQFNAKSCPITWNQQLWKGERKQGILVEHITKEMNPMQPENGKNWKKSINYEGKFFTLLKHGKHGIQNNCNK